MISNCLLSAFYRSFICRRRLLFLMKLAVFLSVRARRRSKQDLMKSTTIYRIEVDRKETHILTISATNGKALQYKIHTFSNRGKSITQGSVEQMEIPCHARRNTFCKFNGRPCALPGSFSLAMRRVFTHMFIHKSTSESEEEWNVTQCYNKSQIKLYVDSKILLR